jgi:hypothetical protein
MKPLAILALIVCVAFYSCKLDNLNPDYTKSLSANQPVLSPKDPTTQGPVAGVWTWSAQYDYGAYEGDLLNPANTGITEILTLAADSTWSQTQNGKVVNSGTYHIGEFLTPDGPRIALSLVNSLHPNPQLYDNFDFSTGFGGSYVCSSDSLVFYGVFNTPKYTNLATERIYVK